MKKIFICYRRAETEYAAGALFRELHRYFGEAQVFRDKEDVGAGVSWRRQVLSEINRESAFLVLIGRDWADARDARGNRRLDDPDDPIRTEILDGLTDGAAVIPVLLENAQMPAQEELPAELASIADLNALRLRDGDWQYDVDRICQSLEKRGWAPVAKEPLAPPAEPGADAPRAKVADERVGFSIKAVVGAVLVSFALVALVTEDLDHDGHVGVVLFSVISWAMGLVAWRDVRRGKAKGRGLAAIVAVLSAVAFFAGVGRMMPNEPALDTPLASETSDAMHRISAESGPAGRTDAVTGRASAPAKLAPKPRATRRKVPKAPVVARAEEGANAAHAANTPGSPPVSDEPQPSPGPAGPSIAGSWNDPDDGTTFMFEQNGSSVNLLPPHPSAPLGGHGTLVGRQLGMTVTLGGIAFAEMHLTLSPDGRMLSGSMTSRQGKTSPLELVR